MTAAHVEPVRRCLALKVIIQVCQAVQHTRQKGIIHRKPSNIQGTIHDPGAPGVPRLYPLWSHAHATGDWTWLEKHWPALKSSLESAKPGEWNLDYLRQEGSVAGRDEFIGIVKSHLADQGFCSDTDKRGTPASGLMYGVDPPGDTCEGGVRSIGRKATLTWNISRQQLNAGLSYAVSASTASQPRVTHDVDLIANLSGFCPWPG